MSAGKSLRLYASPERTCSYLPTQSARNVYADPFTEIDMHIYDALIRRGFRRSGSYLYRPQCEQCHACVPCRVPVADFVPNRSQRRIWKRNQDLEVRKVDYQLNDEYFDLYTKYLISRHAGGGMDNPTQTSYAEFLHSAWSTTGFFEFRLEGRLLCVAVTDYLAHALSAVYTFFDPNYSERGLGVFAVLWQIHYCQQQQLRLRYLYLGYWVNGCAKMCYKINYQPIEGYVNENWQRLDKSERC